jgi:hypothetical protein
MNEIMHCWPKEWIEASVSSGLAIDKGNGRYEFGSNELRDKMAKFAQLVIEATVKEEVEAEREACAKICESMILQSATRDEAHSQSQGNGVAIDCANAIRARK